MNGPRNVQPRSDDRRHAKSIDEALRVSAPRDSHPTGCCLVLNACEDSFEWFALLAGLAHPDSHRGQLHTPSSRLEIEIEKADRVRYIAAWTYCLIQLPCSIRGLLVPLIDVQAAVALKVLLEFLYSRFLFKETQCTSSLSPWSYYLSSAC
jgi:hypothetical protein